MFKRDGNKTEPETTELLLVSLIKHTIQEIALPGSRSTIKPTDTYFPIVLKEEVHTEFRIYSCLHNIAFRSTNCFIVFIEFELFQTSQHNCIFDSVTPILTVLS